MKQEIMRGSDWEHLPQQMACFPMEFHGGAPDVYRRESSKAGGKGGGTLCPMMADGWAIGSFRVSVCALFFL